MPIVVVAAIAVMILNVAYSSYTVLVVGNFQGFQFLRFSQLTYELQKLDL